MTNETKQTAVKDLLIKLDACKDARVWAGEKTIEEIVEQCYRGDWLLWLAAKVDIGLQPLTLAKGHCANTVRHLMKDERSIKAVDTAIAFGMGNASRDELDAAAAAYADAASYSTASAAVAAAAYADAASYSTASAAVAATYAATYAAAAAYAKKENQKQTADICRKYIGQLIIDKIQGGNK